MKKIFAVLWIFAASIVGAVAETTPAPEAVSTDAAARLVKRVFPAAASEFVFEKISDVPASEKIVYEIDNAPGGKIVVRGNTTVALTSGFYQYLKSFCHGQITWGARNIPAFKKGTPLPRVTKKIRHESALVTRYAYNYCTHGYTMSWWSWEDWEKEIDWLALHGFNLALVIEGQEAVWQNTFSKFGYTKEEMRNWLSAPNYLPWQFMGNMEASMPASQNIIDKRAELGKKIADRMRELGIAPVLQGYYGMIPHKFLEKHAGAKVVVQGIWAGGNKRPDMLDPADPLFSPIAKTFYEEQKKLFGDCRFFAADPFHEGGKTGDMDRGTVYRQVQNTMLEFEPNAVLVKQCWQASNSEMFDAGKKDRSLALDLYCDKYPFWKNCNGYNGTPWIWCLLQNFGGNTGMEGNLRGLCNGLRDAMTSPDRGKLVGVGIVPEGSFNNPVIFELLSDIAVRGSVPENVEKWLDAYILSRYGKKSEALSRAWKILLETAYSYTAKEGPLNSALPARPQFGMFIKARFWASNKAIPYNNTKLLEALTLFDSERKNFADKETFRYDFADLQRQVVDNLSHAVYVEINNAWNSHDKSFFTSTTKDFMRLFELSASRFSQFPSHDRDDEAFSQSFAKWLNDAQKIAQKKADKDYLQKCAAIFLTRWVASPGTDLEDYAFREWTGLTENYYAARWKLFFDEAKKALSAGDKFDQDAFDAKLNALEDEWLNNVAKKQKHAARARNTLAEISALVKKYAGTKIPDSARPEDDPVGIQEH